MAPIRPVRASCECLGRRSLTRELIGREMHELASAGSIPAEDTFYCRRVLERLERGEIAVPDAPTMLSYPGGGRASGLQSHGIAAAPHGHWSSATVG